jgi:nifR3 family TIM-barrel protein
VAAAVIEPEFPLQIGRLRLETPLVLAPLAGWTSLAFRLQLRRLGGVGLAVTEVIPASSLLQGHARSHRFLATAAGDEPLSVQINARTPREAGEAARAVEQMGYGAVDFNLGCPVRKVTRKGGGAAMGACPSSAARAIGEAVQAVGIPVTAKLRLGWDAGDLSAPEVARALEDAGVSAIAVHGRTRAQCFAGPVDRLGIRAVVSAVSVPVFANGDVLTVDDALSMLEDTGAAGLMIGRGAVEDPWLFRDVDAALRGADAPPPPTLADHAAFVAAHYHALVELVGEWAGTRQFRKALRTAAARLGAPAVTLERAVRVDGPGDVAAVLAEVVERGGPPRPPGGHVPVPKRPVDHW